ncbi:MAG: beta-lactamase family protein [Defluviitaleaceae bacterium]|nr:beta-lactamase family protein [Defluviitaleaceae bacterium]
MMHNFDDIVEEGFNGVVSISKDGQSLFKKAYGYADMQNRRANKINTSFGTASAGKTFVAAAVLKLICDGKLSFDDNIGDLLDFELNLISPHITIRQLLTHTSGIPDYFDETVMDEYAGLWVDFPNYKIRKSSDLTPLYINKPMMYTPGERFKYNNTGYVVLGLVIEKITGMDFDKYLEEVIFKPCGMKGTGYYELDCLPKNCANAYIYDEKLKRHYTNIYSIDAKGTGAGGAFTTVDDVERFWNNLLGGKILKKDIVQQMTIPQVDTGEYGYGFWIDESGGVIIPYFEGCDPGVSFKSSHTHDIFVCVISNFGDDVWTIHNNLRKKALNS